MKAIRTILMAVGPLLVFLALSVTTARAQVISAPAFTGTFTLPVQAQWGQITLPPGEYTLHYGVLNGREPYLLEVAGKATGSAHGLILPRSHDGVSAGENVLICLRVDDTLYVRSLEMPAIGEAIQFRIPHEVEVRSRVIAGHQSGKANTEAVRVATGIERVPVH